MKVVLLLALFEPFFQGGYLDATRPGFKELLSKLPTEKEAYVSISEDAFRAFLKNSDDPGNLTLERTTEILRFLLYLDGRSELGLLTIAELAYENPEYAAEATNALAALANYYRSGGKSSIPSVELINRFERYMTNPNLFHNARECRNALSQSGTP